MKNMLADFLSFAKKLIPELKTRKPSVGLDIGNHSCKAVELLPTKDSVEIAQLVLEPIVNADVSSAIKKIMTKIDMQTRDVYTSVAGHGTLVRYIDMPKMSLEDARRSFSLEADKYFPFAKEQIYTDCSIINSQREDNKMSLLVAAAKKELIDQRMKLFTELGLDANFIGLNTIALVNAFSEFRAIQERQQEAASGCIQDVFGILDMGDTLTTLVVFKNNVPSFTRDIFIGGRDLNRSISNVLGVSADGAEKLKVDPQDKKEGVLNASESILNNLTSEIRLSFDYFSTEQNAQIGQLFLTGGTSSLIGIEDFFKKSLDIPIEKWNPVKAFIPSAQSSENPSADKVNQDANVFGVALGLALS